MNLEVTTDDETLKPLGKLLNCKKEKMDELKDAVNSEVSLKLDYEHKYNQLLLSPDLTDKVKEATDESRPTSKQKEAYIIEELKTEYDDLELAKSNTSLIRKDLEYIDNIISAEKYALQLQMRS